MKALYFEEHGGPEVLKFGELDDPAVGPGEVLIGVKATSLNHIDLFIRRGMPGIKVPFPHVPGSDAAGVVGAVGEGVTDVSVGDRVLLNPTLSCGHCEFCIGGDAPMCPEFGVIGEHTWGACAEKLVVPEANVIAFPDLLSFVHAAAVPLVFATAWRMLISRGRLRAGEDVLVLGAAAGVGSACIQIAKRAGARVFAAAGSRQKLDFCAKLGADFLINYNEEDFVKTVREETHRRGVDVCVDYVGKDTWVKSLKVLRRGGRLVTCGATTGYDPTTDLRHIFYNQLEIIGSTMGTKNELLAPLRMFFRGEMESMMNHAFDLEDTAQAHRLMENREVIGKVAIRVAQEQ